MKPRNSPRTRGRLRRVPVILQQTNSECGAACLAMILSYFGRKTSIEDCRECINTGRDGVKASVIARTAHTLGLRPRAFSGEPEHFRFVPLPAIVFWEFRHYVVVESWSPKRVEIIDPAVGRRSLTVEEFDAGFTGVILTFEPGVRFEPRSESRSKPWRTYFEYMLGVPGIRSVLAQILGASVLLQVLGLVLPVVTKVVVDTILPSRMLDLFMVMGLGLGVVVLMQVFTSYLRYALLIYLQARLDSQMMLGFFEHLFSLPLPFFQQRSTGDLMLRLNSNSIIREVLTNQTLAAMLDGSLILAYLTILLVQAPSFGLLVLVLGVLQISIPLILSTRVKALNQEVLKSDAESQGYLVEALNGIVTLKASGAEPHALARWSNLFFARLNLVLKRNHLTSFINTSTGMLNSLAPLALLFMGARMVLGGELSLGTMLAFNAVGIAVLHPLSSLVGSLQQLQYGAAHFSRLFDVLLAEPEPSVTQDGPPPVLTGRIELRNVSFRYNPQSVPVLKDVSLMIEPGQKVAIVGPTGSGKTTLGMLLLGLYPPSEGEILYDGRPLSELNLRSVRTQFGVVLQESSVFSGPIRQNIALTSPDTPLEEIQNAAEQASIHDEIMKMPMGYETLVSEKGSTLSGGQMQRLALARALLSRPTILLLDEATSHLDVLTEERIDRSLNRLGSTRIVIAHRLSTIRDADCILVVEDGQIVERGSHAELLRRGGHYSRLISRQLEGDRQVPVALRAVNQLEGRYAMDDSSDRLDVPDVVGH
jgi:ATP-binding cassette, subfamily B, bacterial